MKNKKDDIELDRSNSYSVFGWGGIECLRCSVLTDNVQSIFEFRFLAKHFIHIVISTQWSKLFGMYLNRLLFPLLSLGVCQWSLQFHGMRVNSKWLSFAVLVETCILWVFCLFLLDLLRSTLPFLLVYPNPVRLWLVSSGFLTRFYMVLNTRSSVFVRIKCNLAVLGNVLIMGYGLVLGLSILINLLLL